MKSSGEHRAGNRGPLVSDSNTRVVLGSLHAGMGNTHLNNLVSAMNIPTMNHRLFKRREREAGNDVDKVARESCEMNLNLEKKKLPSNPLVYQQMALLEWQFLMIWVGKKGEGDIIFQLVMGLSWVLLLEKMLVTPCRLCRAYSHKKLTGKDKRYDCRKNHCGSSKSTERDVACELWSKAPKSGVKFSIYVGDDDSTTLADMKKQNPLRC